MTSNYGEAFALEKATLQMALHSSSETFGVAVLDRRDVQRSLRIQVFPIGRNLSNSLFNCVEKVLPFEDWKNLSRVAVATGPGGFTGTRLTVVMARTIAQQLDCPLDGVSSFALMAPRLSTQLDTDQLNEPFWLVKSLNRRGIVGGQYRIQTGSSIPICNEVCEIEFPHLLPKGRECLPAIDAEDDVVVDVKRLLDLSVAWHASRRKAFWKEVLPIYPTSPVENV